ncbi:uncharacterized protein LOC143024510 [Oratosquilla oratoria]|uniref:uncharacterized protein LOC143024510 n=1 Tax=Oratosquilla oratoria TaxID=337810 RepID=UPI003F771EAC
MECEGIIASLDVENLYTNINIDRTIQFFLEEIYSEGSPPKIDIPKVSLQALLELCTKESPFVSPDGRMFRQIDGVAMGSPLGVLFANFFMGRIEREVFSIQQKPRIYARYIDDIFVLAKDDDELRHLHHCLQEASGLNLSVENSSDGCLPFLDILVNQQPHGFYTKVFCLARWLDIRLITGHTEHYWTPPRTDVS